MLGFKLEIIYDIFVQFSFIHNRKTTPSWGFRDEAFYCCNLIFIYEGEGTFERNGVTKAVHKGDIVFFEHGDQRVLCTNPNNLLQFYTVNFQYSFPTEKNGTWYFENISLPFDFVKNIQDNEIFLRLISLFDQLCNVHLSGSIDKISRERTLFVKILELIIFAYNPNSINYSNKKKINRIVEYMNEHYSEKITLKQLANTENISASYLDSIFKAITGLSPIEYLINIRFNKAKQLLAGNSNISDIALKVGFTDIYYFSKAFKKFEGITPSQYKKLKT